MADYFNSRTSIDGYDRAPREDPIPRAELPELTLGHIALIGEFPTNPVEIAIHRLSQALVVVAAQTTDKS